MSVIMNLSSDTHTLVLTFHCKDRKKIVYMYLDYVFGDIDCENVADFKPS